MYIEYITPQRVASTDYTEYDSKGGNYRPTWLIRTSDWEKVPGTEATDGYHTLSYVWEQSGGKFQKPDGEYGLIDEGYHQITRKVDGMVDGCYATYDAVLQQICKDFDIEYLWYDKICIDQTNKAEKQREIKQMHLIYSNARYTVALVPEVNIENPEEFDRISWAFECTEAKKTALTQMGNSLWWKRSWTLEEVMMSTRMLIVGRNTHFWSLADIKQGDKQKEDDILAHTMLGFKEQKMKSASQVLYFAHSRTSTKQHDKVFALANIFHGITDIDIDYSIDVSIAMNRFYRQLAEKDLSLLCFGSNLDENGNLRYVTTMGSYNLPSWTGVAGVHSLRAISDITLDHNCDYAIDDNMRLHIKCRSYTLHPTKYNDYNLFINDERISKANEYYFRVITSMDDFDGNESEALDWSQWCLYRAAHCNSTHYHKPDGNVPFLSPILPLSLTEECEECVILGVVFDSMVPVQTSDNVFVGYDHSFLSPVAKKSTDGFSYRIIGVVLLKHFQYDEPRNSPQEVMNKMLNNLGCETQEFYIN